MTIDWVREVLIVWGLQRRRMDLGGVEYEREGVRKWHWDGWPPRSIQGKSKDEGGAEVYFKGARRHGGLELVAFWNDAARFSSKDSALECAATHPDLRNSEVWKPVQITHRCTRTS